MVIGQDRARRDSLECRDPDAIANPNRPGEEAERRVVPVMISGEDEGSLTDADVRSDRNLAMIVDPDAFPDPNMIADV
jgi:hypothetical protein